jgi:ATP-dependent RNA helicase DeaD
MSQKTWLKRFLDKMKTFEELKLSEELLKVLHESGIQIPTEIQEKTIPLALAGRDIIGGSATGSGKTLAFASPILENLKQNDQIQALILTPTRELAEQVANSIKKFSRNKSLNITSIYGGVRIEPQIRNLARADVVVGTPGRILDHLQRGTLRLNEIKFLVLDEVDRMFDMGFYQDVERIIKQCPEKRQTMLFSATISADMDYLAKRYTKNAEEISVESYIDHSKLKQVYYDIDSRRKFSLLVYLLKKEEANLIMIFSNTKRNVDFVTENLNLHGINAKAIHGGMVQKKRTSVLRSFNDDGVKVLVCTDVASRGLDINGVSHIYNYDLPKTSNEYIHRIGRTARAGKEGKAISLLCSRDYENFGNILRDDFLNISLENLPKFEIKQVRMQYDKRRTRFQGSNNRFNNNNQQRNRPRNYRGRTSSKPAENNSNQRNFRSNSSSRFNSNRGNRHRRN